jgi:hypothetical protein
MAGDQKVFPKTQRANLVAFRESFDAKAAYMCL